MPSTSSTLAALAVAGVIAAAACSSPTSSNTCGSGTAPVVIGTYALISYTLGTTTITTAQGASGQLRFYASSYGFNLSIPGQAAVADSGTYSISGVKCMSETSVLGQGSTTGTFTLSGTTPGSVLTFTGMNTLVGAVGFAGQKQ